MKLASLAICLIAAAGSAHASDGPFSHTSDGVTPAYIQYDASGAIVDLQCVPGSVCATRTASAPLTANGTQFSAFDFRPEPPFVDHYAFGVRGNPSNIYCNASVKSFPFLGRGMIIVPSTGKIGFENFTTNCLDPNGGVAWSTMRNFNLEQMSSTHRYRVEIWADATNTGYKVSKVQYIGYGLWVPSQVLAEGNCLAQASAADAAKCARHPADPVSANRAFIIGAVPSGVAPPRWSTADWYLDATP
jgi:hypothetical protein